MNVIAYRISNHDSGTRMSATSVDVPACVGCGRRVDQFYHNPEFRFDKTLRFDTCATYDGQALVSARFKEFCISNQLSGVTFLDFKLASGVFHLIVDRIVPFDTARRGTRFSGMCPTCKRYWSVIGATPAYLVGDRKLEEGLYRSDLFFGEGDEQHPLLFAGISTAEKMLASGLCLDLRPVFAGTSKE
jgi:hypothetical protein